MTDRELLELAAKAVGYAIHDFYLESEAWAYVEGSEPNHDGELPIFLWRPLTDDGDAFRLAMRLHINIEHLQTKGNQPYGVNCWPNGRGDCASISTDLDEYAAGTRRAITRAAAEIGRSL